MKAIILAGGQGTRLHPVTQGRLPKPMVPLAGRPVLEWLLLRLRADGIRDVYLTLQCLPEQIESYFGDGSALGMRLHCRRETVPLGTAGAVAACRDFTQGESFVVLSGDGVFDFSLRPLIEAHRDRRAAVTMALSPHAAPLSYGLAVTDREGRIRAFVEKPDWPRVVTDLVNTGIYVLSPSALDCVPEGEPFDFARDLFPLLMERGELLTGVAMEGYWRDIGEPAAYFRANLDALEGRLKLPLEPPAVRGRSEKPRTPREQYACRVSVVTPRRAALMRLLSAELMEAGADFTDGITFREGESTVRIAPDAEEERLFIDSDSPDAAQKTRERIESLLPETERE